MTGKGCKENIPSFVNVIFLDLGDGYVHLVKTHEVIYKV